MDPSLRDSLRRQLHNFKTLPYWSRIWIAQEILLPETSPSDTGRLNILLGPRVVEFSYLYDLVCGLESEFEPKVYFGSMFLGNGREDKVQENNMYHSYAKWREYGRWTWTGPNAGMSLPELLAVFRHCKSGDRRDRIFALLSLTKEKPQIEIDYGMNDVSLLKHVMERFMDGTALDELLWLGAALIEALEIRYPQQPLAATESSKEDDTTTLPVRGPPRTSIGNLTWAETTLLVLCKYGLTRKLMRSVSFAINDGNDIHIFEYAVEDYEEATIVNFARSHEYVRGQPANVRHCSWQVELGKCKRTSIEDSRFEIA
jgi:hypothetical protein